MTSDGFYRWSSEAVIRQKSVYNMFEKATTNLQGSNRQRSGVKNSPQELAKDF